jgi:septal ring factor EnvC (AmiA/AmiB activator)
MDNGGIWPGDERYFQNIRETALQDTIEQLTKELAEARAEIERLTLELENKQYTITCASEENQQLKESLAEARAEIEKQDTLLEKCLSLLKRQKEKEEL